MYSEKAAHIGTATISVVSHGNVALVEHFLAGLARIASPHIAHVIVTLNLPGEAMPVVPPQLAVQVIRNERPRGFGANHNAAFSRCKTPVFVVVNPDIEFEADPFPALLATLARDTVALAAPVVLEVDGRIADSQREWLTPMSLLRRHVLRQRRSAENAAWYAGMFLALSSAAFRSVGGFDTRYHMYCEDADLSARLRLAGYSITSNDQAVVVHRAQRDSRRSWAPLRWHLASLARLWRSSVYWRYCAMLKRERWGA